MAANNKYDQLSRLIIDLMDNKCSEKEFEQFQELICSKPEFMRYYVEFVSMFSLLDRREHAAESPTHMTQEDTTIAMLDLMAKQELEASPIQEIADTKNADNIRKTQMTKKNLKSYFFGIAAFVLICFGVLWLDKKIVNYHATNILPKLAKISCEVKSDFRFKGEKLHEGQWLWPGDYSLKDGTIELAFENGTKVILESPVEFSLKSQDKIYLKFGRLYAQVPPQAVGFAIDTKYSKVVDLGTEFGMMVNVNGDTDLHVYDGKTALFSGNDSGYNFKQTIVEGQARTVDSYSGNVSNIALDEGAFARAIDPISKHIWYGDTNINLADIVGGGNGFGTGQLELGINPDTGKRETGINQDRKVEGKFVATKYDKYIDGVFVPVGSNQQISSTGILFKECPKTNTNFYLNITNGKGSADWAIEGIETSKLGNRIIGTPDYPSILMHANLGITFDLNAIRNDLADSRLTFDRFKADTGFTSAGNLDNKGKADVYVLIDGKIKYNQSAMDNCNSIYNIDLEIKETDRFLTLISTDGGDPDDTLISTWADWCVFAKPELILKTK